MCEGCRGGGRREEGGGRQRKRWWVGGPPASPHHSAAKIAGNDGRAATSTTKTAENSAFRGAENQATRRHSPPRIFSAFSKGSEPVSSVYSITAHDHTSAAAPSYGSPDDTSGAMYFPAPTCAAGTSGSVALAAKECEKSHSLSVGGASSLG